jgi:FkbM family methyltransferase
MSDDGPRKYFALNDLDKKVEKYVDFDGGVFVEAGANDGVDQSNSYYFEKHRGWTGVLIEPIPKQFKLCRERRPQSQCFWSALVPPNWSDPFVELTYCNLMTVTNAGGVLVDTAKHVETGKVFLHEQDPVTQIFAPARTVSSILLEANVRKVDLFSLDVEGYEKPVLSGIDLTMCKVKYFLVETVDPTGVAATLGSGYKIVDQLSHHDYLYQSLY